MNTFKIYIFELIIIKTSGVARAAKTAIAPPLLTVLALEFYQD